MDRPIHSDHLIYSYNTDPGDSYATCAAICAVLDKLFVFDELTMRFIPILLMLWLISSTALAENIGAAPAQDIGCPKGTIRNGENGPGITQAWCELATDRSQFHGPYRSWYGNGVLGTMENFNHGKRDGKAEYRWGNGRLQASGQYKNGERDGKWMFSDVGGSKTNHVLYKHGKLLSGHEPKWVTERNAAAD